MSKKQITELESADSLDDGDLILVRKTGAGVDRKLTKDKLVDSLGSSVISGYQAASTQGNKIDLTASNKAVLKEYADGMHICFISPIASSGVVEVKIDSLLYVKLEQYNNTNTAELVANEYVEAVYSNGVFKQTNKLNTNLVYSNEYTAIGKTEGELPGRITIYELTSAVGVKKTEYYTGMSLLFTVPIDSEGGIYVDVDGLGRIFLNDGTNNYFNNNVYKDQVILAIYNGERFVRHKLPSIEEPSPIVVPDTSVILPEPTIADDPASADNPNAVDSRGNPLFKKIIQIGVGKDFKNLTEAVVALQNEYGKGGNGSNYALVLTSSYVAPKTEQFGQTRQRADNDTAFNFNWISIFADQDRLINLSNCSFILNCKTSPIINFKSNINPSADYLKSNREYPFANFGAGKIVFGKLFECNYVASNITATNTNPSLFYANGETSEIEAKYGFKVITNLLLNFESFDKIHINEGSIAIQKKPNGITFQFGDNQYIWLHRSTTKMSNMILNTNITDQGALYPIVYVSESSVELDNVKSLDRIGTKIGIGLYSNGKLELRNCDFASSTSGSPSAGYDIYISGNSDSRIYLDNTTGNTNQAIGTQTSKGLIQNID
jgi:hypothetical protein